MNRCLDGCRHSPAGSPGAPNLDQKKTELKEQKSEDLVEPVENDTTNYEKKPSRKERSIKAKFKEDEGKVNKDDSPDIQLV